MDEVQTLMVSVIKIEQVKEECTDWNEWQAYIEDQSNKQEADLQYGIKYNVNVAVPYIKKETSLEDIECVGVKKIQTTVSEETINNTETNLDTNTDQMKESLEEKKLQQPTCCKHGLMKEMPENSLHPAMFYPFSCHICDKPYFRRGFLEKHFNEHLDNLSCAKCDTTFDNRSLLINHLLVQSKVRICKCSKSKSKKNTFKHIQPKTDEKQHRFKCNKCNRTFKHRQVFERHFLTHTAEKLYKCSSCEREFTYLDVYKRHLLIHTNIYPFKCLECGKMFRQQSTLNKHSRTHTGLKPYHCKICQKSFSQSSSLTRHSLRHTGEKSFICAECGRGFTRKGHIRDHILLVHNLSTQRY